MQFVYYQSHSYPKTAECSGRPGFAKDDMASKKYRINQGLGRLTRERHCGRVA